MRFLIGKEVVIKEEVKEIGDVVVKDDKKLSLRQILEDQSKKVETKEYDPKKCTHMINGHCDDEEGGAWKYRDAFNWTTLNVLRACCRLRDICGHFHALGVYCLDLHDPSHKATSMFPELFE